MSLLSPFRHMAAAKVGAKEKPKSWVERGGSLAAQGRGGHQMASGMLRARKPSTCLGQLTPSRVNPDGMMEEEGKGSPRKEDLDLRVPKAL